MLAAEELVCRGYTVLRMGAVVKKPLKTVCPKIIDYATKCRSDFMDIYLEAKCSFHLGSPSGLNAVPIMFRRPRATVNFSALEYIYSWSSNELIIPKKMWLKDEKRFMTFREIFESGTGKFLRTQKFAKHGIELIENTPEEILDVTTEMDGRLKGAWGSTEEDEELQERFWDIFPKSELHGEIYSRIGAEFLRQNQELLE